jgi:prepilin-type N-terminal cleavage/methylation domain-containing protein
MRLRTGQSGFTLVEIAIVLVIIGLLLGGILKGQELITSARVRNIADQNSGVQAAYYGFIDRYRQVPGDWDDDLARQAIPTVGSGAGHGGNGNGRLDGGWDEAVALWEHLSKAGFIQGAYVGGAVENDQPAANQAPRNAFQGTLVLYETDDYADEGTAPIRLNLVLGAGIPVNVVRELDVKVDDGFPTTGVLRHAATAGAALGAVAQSAAACVDANATPDIWDIAGNAQNCNAVYVY